MFVCLFTPGFRDYPVRSDGKNNTVSQDSYKRVLPKFVIPNPKTINERYLRNGELEFAKDVFARETVPCVCGLVLAEAIVCAPYFAAGLYRWHEPTTILDHINSRIIVLRRGRFYGIRSPRLFLLYISAPPKQTPPSPN